MDSTRRNFLKVGVLTAASLPLIGTIAGCLKGEESYPEGLKPVAGNDPVASSLGYAANAAAVDAGKYPKKAADGAAAKCVTCQLYTKTTNDKWGKCTLFQGKLVASEGWCNSWVKKV